MKSRHVYNPWTTSRSPAPADFCGCPSNPVFGAWIQLTKLWTDSLMAFVPGACSFTPQSRSGTSCPPCAPVSVQIITNKKPVPIVSVRLDIHAAYVDLTVDNLTPKPTAARTGQYVTLTARIDNECDNVLLSVEVGDDVPPGRYAASIRDNSGASRGDLLVEVPDPNAQP